VPVKGAKEVSRNFKKLTGNIAGNISELTMTKVLIAGRAASDRITPVDTQNLIGSGFKRVEKTANGWAGQVGYIAEYSVFVHDGGPKNWQKAAAEDKFLLKGFERDAISEIINIINKGYKV
jgi:hypothetical protein